MPLPHPPGLRPPQPGGVSDLGRRASEFVGQLHVPQQTFVSTGHPWLDSFLHMGRQALAQPSASWSPNPAAMAAGGANAADIMANPSLASHFYNQFMTSPAS